jgi:sphingosine kinase
MSDKEALVESLREYTSSAPHYDVPPAEEGPATALPPLQHTDTQDGWITFEGPILFMYAGKGPLVSR